MGDEARRCKHCGNAVGRRCPGHLDACSTECLVALYDSALVDLLVERERTEDAETRGRLAGLREAAEVCRKMAVAEYEQSHEEGSASVIAHEIAGEALSQAQADIRKLIEEAEGAS